LIIYAILCPVESFCDLYHYGFAKQWIVELSAADTAFFRYGCPPHGGFGLGVDRLTMLLLGVGIKEAMFLFRSPSRQTP